MEEKKDYIGGTAQAAKTLVNGLVDLAITNKRAVVTMLEKYGTGLSGIYQAAKKESVNPIKGFAETFKESFQNYRTMIKEVKARKQPKQDPIKPNLKPDSIDEIVTQEAESIATTQPDGNAQAQNKTPDAYREPGASD